MSEFPFELTGDGKLIYTCFKSIGQGAFGKVYKAQRNDILKKFAIKQIILPDK